MSTDPQAPFRTHTRPGDAPAVEDLVRQTGVFNAPEIAIARELVEDNLAQGDAASGYHFLFADGADGLDGYTCFGHIPATQGRYELYWIAVSPAGRRARLGQRLMQASEDAVRALGGVYLFAETSTSAHYDAARKFYLAQGYRLVATKEDWYADGEGLETYGKRLVARSFEST
jgi:ribosomal protein S18 acetylase RimI-like enzyme